MSLTPLVLRHFCTRIQDCFLFQTNEIYDHRFGSDSRSRAGRKLRQPRSVSKPRHVEVLLVADSTMSDFHQKGNVETYLLTIMNMVRSCRLYRFAIIKETHKIGVLFNRYRLCIWTQPSGISSTWSSSRSSCWKTNILDPIWTSRRTQTQRCPTFVSGNGTWTQTKTIPTITTWQSWSPGRTSVPGRMSLVGMALS